MTGKPKVSIIVPVYNTEKYLDKCISSIVGQTLKDIEIILVDDGSTDTSSVILQKWEARDSRISLIHLKNSGQATARNCGMAIASGQYIGFVDSDDYLEREMYEKLYDAIASSNADVVQCNQNIIADEDYENTENINRMEKLNHSAEGLVWIDNKIYGNTPPWNKLYRRFLIQIYNLRFPDGLYGPEDDAFHWFFITLAKNIYFIPDKLYNYVLRHGSYMDSVATGNVKYPFGVLYALERIFFHLIEYRIEKIYNEQYLRAYDHFLSSQIKNLPTEQKIRAEKLSEIFLKRYGLVDHSKRITPQGSRYERGKAYLKSRLPFLYH